MQAVERAMNILELPIEVLEHVISKVEFSEVCRVRIVSQRFNQACSSVLNKAFSRALSDMQYRFQDIKGKMPRRESARRKHPLARECDIIETIHMRLTVLQMTFGRHISRGHCCFFPGQILDEINSILRGLKDTSGHPPRAYKVTDELFDLTTMAMEYFKEKIECTLPEISYFTAEFPDLASPSPPKYSFPKKLSSKWSATSLNIGVTTPPHTHRPQSATKTNTNDVAFLRRELKTCKNRVLYQHKKILECESKLEQNEQRFQEQDRKIEALVKELQVCRAHLQLKGDWECDGGDDVLNSATVSTHGSGDTTDYGVGKSKSCDSNKQSNARKKRKRGTTSYEHSKRAKESTNVARKGTTDYKEAFEKTSVNLVMQQNLAETAILNFSKDLMK